MSSITALVELIRCLQLRQKRSRNPQSQTVPGVLNSVIEIEDVTLEDNTPMNISSRERRFHG